MKKTLKIIGNVLIWAFVVFSVAVTVLVFASQNNKDGLSSVFGKAPVSILSNSMNPTFKQGDLIFTRVLKEEERNNMKVGDIISFYVDLNEDGQDEINTHRIVEVYKEGGYTYYRTKGDNNETNPTNDKDPVVAYKVLAVYSGSKLVGVGNFINFLKKPLGFGVVIVLPLIAFFLFEMVSFILTVVKMKQAKAPISKETEEEIKKRAIEEYLKEQASNSENTKQDKTDN